MSDLKIFTDDIEPAALDQIYALVEQPAFENCKIRIMPDVHAGAGCVIGFTADLGDKVIPNIVGVDIGCGMLTVELGNVDINFEKLDSVIRNFVPSAKTVNESKLTQFQKLNDLYCYNHLWNISRIEYSLGTLGSGNHFIEIDEDSENNKYLIIHSGSRNLGKQVADYYQKLAIDTMRGKDDLKNAQDAIVKKYKEEGRKNEIEKALKELHGTFQYKKLNTPKELCYLSGENREKYLHDMYICQEYADTNRKLISQIILNHYGLRSLGNFTTIHNYIEKDSNIVRKGAISAKIGERVLIPINMRDGCIIGIGKGNPDWNESAPHGAGRRMSRSKAKEEIDIDEFRESMKGIFTTCVGEQTLDESPMAYKPMEEIINTINDTIEIQKIIKPIYNFKASE